MESQWSGEDRQKDMREMTQLTAKLMSLHEDVGEIKGALKDLTSAITKLALIEERQSVTNAALERAFVAISRVEDRLTELERLAPMNNQSRVWVERFVLALAGAALVFIWDQVKR